MYGTAVVKKKVRERVGGLGSVGGKRIPEYLVYEVIDGHVIYYRGYQDVLLGKQTLEDIMGASAIHSFILLIIKDYLTPLLGKPYWLMTGEMGLRLKMGGHVAGDIVIYERSAWSEEHLTSKLTEIIPSVVIEIDTSADPTSHFTYTEYYQIKTLRLLDFGVSQVVWVHTLSRLVMVAERGDWKMIGWDEEFTVLGQTFSINGLIREEGFDPEKIGVHKKI